MFDDCVKGVLVARLKVIFGWKVLFSVSNFSFYSNIRAFFIYISTRNLFKQERLLNR